jgi:shikimate dehydrogenase
VNTLKFDDGAILGDNTDGVGLVTDIVRNAGFELAHKKILLLGAGGAARGVLLPLLERQPAQLTIANRTAAKARQLVQQFQQQRGGCLLNACGFAEATQQYDLVINATSASLQAELPPLAASVFGPAALAYDMMYGAQPTIFMQFAASHGARVRDGLGMLVEQAAESFFVWRGVRPHTDELFAALRAQL